MTYFTKKTKANTKGAKIEKFLLECCKHTENSFDDLLNQIVNCPLDFGVILFNTDNVVLSIRVNEHKNQLQIF